eukprot:1998763-Pyramimonas_sp.AAC.1
MAETEECWGFCGQSSACWTPSGRSLAICGGRSMPQAAAHHEACSSTQFEQRQVGGPHVVQAQ